MNKSIKYAIGTVAIAGAIYGVYLYSNRKKDKKEENNPESNSKLNEYQSVMNYTPFETPIVQESETKIQTNKPLGNFNAEVDRALNILSASKISNDFTLRTSVESLKNNKNAEQMFKQQADLRKKTISDTIIEMLTYGRTL